MPQRRRTTLLWQLAFLASLSGCMSAPGGGSLCDVVPGPLLFSPETSAQIVRTDRQTAVEIDTLNRVGANACGW